VPEIVIVISDLYLPAAHTEVGGSLTGLDRIATLGERLILEHGWRAWLARWIGREDLVGVPTSLVAAAGDVADELTSWMATPLHLAAGLTTLHFDARGILRLSRQEQEALARDFHDPGMQLVPLPSGEFLLLQPRVTVATTTEPPRIAGGNVAEALPKGDGAAQLRRLGAEIEMWLHDHPVNRARAGRNQLTISTLWIWGGGSGNPVARASTPALPRAFGSDSYLDGLWRLCGGEPQPLPEQLESTYAEGAVLVVEARRMLRTNALWSVPELLVELDRRFIAPAVDALRRGEIGRVSILVNDRCLAMSFGDRRKFWRRRRSALESLR
jgi:hypothetical protein